MQSLKYLQTKNSTNFFAKEWSRLEKEQDAPAVYRKLISVDYEEFASKIIEQDSKFVKETINNLYHGDMYILKNSLKKKKVKHIIDEIHKFTQSSPSSFHKMLEGIPNFHRWIGKDLINAYTIKYSKHSTHIFPWNEDISDVRKIIMEVCKPLKFLAGLSFDEFKENTPKDLIVERLQIARYPPTGFIEPHIDANTLLRLVISGYLTTRGLDYEKGGFYLVDKNDVKFDIENEVEAGDIGLFYASIRHGLDMIDPEKSPDVKKKNGRWWFGLNVHNSDEMKEEDRKTTSPYKILEKR
mgnify:FL=1